MQRRECMQMSSTFLVDTVKTRQVGFLLNIGKNKEIFQYMVYIYGHRYDGLELV